MTDNAQAMVLRTIPPELHAGLQPVLAREPERSLQRRRSFDRNGTAEQRFNLRTLLRPARGSLAVAVGLIGLETLAAQAGPLLVQRAVDLGIGRSDRGMVVTSASFYVLAVIAGYLLSGARLWWTGRLGQNLTRRLRIHVFEHLQRLSQAYFTEERIGRLLTRMTSDIDALAQLLQDGIVNVVVQGLTLTIVTLIMFRLDARLALVIVLLVAPVMTIATLWFRTSSQRAYAQVRERIAELLADLQENLAGARVITAANRVGQNRLAHRRLVGRHRDAMIRAGTISGVYSPTAETIGRVGQIAVLLVGGRLVIDGSMQIGELIAFVLYLSAFFAPIQELANLYNQYQSGQAAVSKIADLLAEQPTVPELPGANPLVVHSGAISFDRVSFGYRANQRVIDDVSLEIEGGEVVAIVGGTGAGKSTLAKLLTRTYDPDLGRVIVDGNDVRDVSLSSLRTAIGVVPQEPFLFAGALRRNLVVGRPDATDDEVVAVCRSLGLWPLLERLGSLDARIAERGVGLSAGERQLVALARALIPGPKLLVLDEATSNLDLASERVVEHALDVALEGRTALLVAHRLSTAERADRVVVMHDGRVIEQGPHAELVTEGGHYSRMFATWSADDAVGDLGRVR